VLRRHPGTAFRVTEEEMEDGEMGEGRAGRQERRATPREIAASSSIE
jgi:hypothetical protein